MKQAYEIIFKVPAYSNTYTIYADNSSEAEEKARQHFRQDGHTVELYWQNAHGLRIQRDLTEEEVQLKEAHE